MNRIGDNRCKQKRPTKHMAKLRTYKNEKSESAQESLLVPEEERKYFSHLHLQLAKVRSPVSLTLTLRS